MRKIVVIVIILLFLSLSGIQGCTPPGLEDIKGRISPGKELIRLRGLSIEFEKGRPHLSSKEGEKLPVIKAGSDFDIALRINNYMLKPISGDIKVYNLARYAANIRDGQGFYVEEAVMQDGKIYPGVASVEFPPYIYDKAKVGEGLEDSLITEVDIDYEAFINADLCFSKEEEQIPGILCYNDEILTENVLKGDAGALPVSIDRIVKEVNVRDYEAEFYLTIKLKNFGDGSIEEKNKLTDFSVSMLDGDISPCGDEVKFRDGKAEVECKGSINLGDESFIKTPVEFRFSYSYKVIRTIHYKVI